MGNISMMPELNPPHNHRPLDRQNIPRPIRAHLWPGVHLFPDAHNGPAQGQVPRLVTAAVLSQGNNLHPQAAIAPSQVQASGLVSAATLSQNDVLHPQAALAPFQGQSSGLRAPAALLQGDVFYQRDSGAPLLPDQVFHPGAQAVSFQGHARNLPVPPDLQDSNVDSVSTSLSELSMVADSRRNAAIAGNRETPVPQAGPSTYRRDREPSTPSNARGEQNTPRYSHPSAASVSQSPVRSASQRSYTGRSQTRDPTPASERGLYPDVHRFLRDAFAGINSDPPPHFARAFTDIGVTNDLRLDLLASSDPQAGDWGNLEQALLRGDMANYILWLAVKKGLKERAERIMLGRRR
ncbi:uncharacterized protein LAESUDRAFT_52664 [Laetiporus sulphureus 93-53]|uniref:Uncharacterized protein n=1 Tax=Laetiporus sulphureus 93-53 TaxID=1314785 RepID=A0A165FC04_9APHY|nr:uncharacterized protein LAESUDRAFT_52664 [Laetiporus sulphureus 93-53]KZT08739.1 hypothetical protein LAESUDRAFT_52664 [Laetiporus sulphureus 93-53]